MIDPAGIYLRGGEGAIFSLSLLSKGFLCCSEYVGTYIYLHVRGARKLQTDRPTHRTTTVTLAAHACRGFIIILRRPSSSSGSTTFSMYLLFTNY